MVEIELKEWGNSIGMVLPVEEVRRMGLESGDTVVVNIVKKERIDAFGMFRGAPRFERDVDRF